MENSPKALNIMIQGTSSGAGKSMVSTGLCRFFVNEGYKIAPFKGQNMALNSFVTENGKEIGRAQAVQAEAAKVMIDVRMNPVLLKPTSHSLTQVIVEGKVYSNISAGEFHRIKKTIKPFSQKAYESLAKEFELIIIEGAGSPAEINLLEDDFANMGMAIFANAPVILVADIDRGGAFAAIYGTVMLLPEEERKHIKGIIINKFRGKKDFLQTAIDKIEFLTGIPVLGVLPYCDVVLEDEDSLSEKLSRRQKQDSIIRIAVPRLPHISNHTDFDVFSLFPDTDLYYVGEGESINNPDFILIPGTKNTIDDLLFLRRTGLENQILNAHKQGVPLFGICGGYQMLGSRIMDPLYSESDIEEIAGMGLLDHETIFDAEKITMQCSGVLKNAEVGFLKNTGGQKINGYQIHCGRTKSREVGLFKLNGGNEIDGGYSSEREVAGTYLHGIFDNIEFTKKVLNNLREKKGLEDLHVKFDSYQEFKESQYDKLAILLKENLDMEKVHDIIKRGMKE